ncbi:MAG: hypothetical protein ABSH50_03840 [Bryobacteraceae bacterium]|jgi:hypothetical protein
MNKYLVLYRSEAALAGMSMADMFANTPPEQMAAGMALWNAWYQKCGSAVMDLGAPLDRSTTVQAGSSTPGKTSITGYSILQAESMQHAVSLIQDHPHFRAPGASIEILECVRMPGM